MANQNKHTKQKDTRGRMGRIQQLPAPIKATLDQLLVSGVAQTTILEQLKPLLQQAGEQPVGAAVLNRYASKMEAFGRRLRESREVAEVWTAKFGEAPTGELSQHIINILRTISFEFLMDNDGAKDDEGRMVISPQVINELALAVQRFEKAAELSTKREKELRKAFAEQAEKEVKKAGVSPDTAHAIRAAMEKSF